MSTPPGPVRQSDPQARKPARTGIGRALQAPGARRRVVLFLVAACVLSALAVAAMGWGWEAMGGSPMTSHGWAALTIGSVGTALLTAVLILLAFHSDSSGHDDRL